MVGDAEAALEGASGNTAMQVGLVPVVLALVAADDQVMLAELDLQVILREAGHRHGDAVGLLVLLFDVVGRIAEAGLVHVGNGLQQARQTVKADRRTEQRTEIKSATHDTLLMSCIAGADDTQEAPSSSAWIAMRPSPGSDLGMRNRQAPGDFKRAKSQKTAKNGASAFLGSARPLKAADPVGAAALLHHHDQK